MRHPIVDETGQERGILEIPEELLRIPRRPHLWWQVAVAETANCRSGTASTKTRSEVRGGGAKPWRQKGTGRARQGTTRAPQWTGGGLSHGPRPRSHGKDTPRRQRRMAFYGLLTERLSIGESVVVDSLPVQEGKTREVERLLRALTEEKGDVGHRRARSRRILVLLDRPAAELVRAAANLGGVRVRLLQGVSFGDLVWAERLVFTTAAAREALKEAEKWLVKRTGS